VATLLGLMRFLSTLLCWVLLAFQAATAQLNHAA